MKSYLSEILIFKLLFCTFLLVGCNSKEANKNIIKKTSQTQYNVSYELNSIYINGKDYKFNKPILKKLRTNQINITPIKLNDTLTIGIEVVVFNLQWKNRLNRFYDIYYYTKDRKNNWHPLLEESTPSFFSFKTKHIHEMEDYDTENSSRIHKTKFSVTFSPSLNKIENFLESKDEISKIKYKNINNSISKYKNKNKLLSDFNKILYKDSFDLNVLLGNYYLYNKSYKKALAFFKKAHNINNENADIFVDLYLVYCNLKKYKIANYYIDKAIKIDQNNWNYLNNKCWILGRLNQYQKGIDIGRISLNLNPDNKRIYGNMMYCFDKLHQKDSVIKYLNLIKSRFDIGNWREKQIKKKYHI